ncbi:MAG: Ig-like domain-containing protein, partial [Armatimonadetes bacterium]|nr:Ig-like domain-containing protein [Armatimonadota bacterium]
DLTTDAGRFVNLPANATTLDSNARQVRLTWQRVGGDVEAYNIYRSSSPIGPSQLGPSSAPGIARVGTVTGSQTSFDDTNLNNNATFYYAVTSVDSQGAESEFGKGTTPDTGVIAIPHASPASLTFTVDKQNLSGNGMSTTRATVTIKDASNAPAAGVQVDLTTDAGRFVNLPANATTLDSNARQVQALTDLQGQVVIDLQSAVVTTAGQQLSVNLRARAAELPDAVEEQSRTVSFLASRPVVISLSPTTNQLTADRASTTDVTARVLDALGQPVPDNLFSVDFVLESTNGSIRRAGNVQQFPFIDGTPTATVRVPVVNGQAVAVYRSGNDASTLGSPPANIVPIQATAVEEPAVTSRTIITLVPGAPARIDFGGVNQITIPRGQSQTINVVVRDAQNNPVRAGVNVNFAVQPEGPVTVPPTGTTDNNGQISLQITAGPDAGGAVVVGTISGTQVQSQLAVTVQ